MNNKIKIINNCPMLLFPTHLLVVTAGEAYSARRILILPLHVSAFLCNEKMF